MLAATPSRDVPALRMVEAMTVCAYELGMAAAEIAGNAGDDFDRLLSFSAEFRHCFFAVRMGMRLTQFGIPTPRAATAAGPPAATPVSERDRLDRTQAPERDPAPRRDDIERERDGDSEPVSLPQFLKTLGIVSTRAERVRDQLPAHVRDTTLPALQALLAKAAPPDLRSRPPGPALAVLARPPTTAPPARSHLLNSARAAQVIPGRPPPRPSG